MIKDDHQPLDDFNADVEPPLLDGARLARVLRVFVALGIALRVGRYLMDYPLWWDEAFVGSNFLKRGYLDLVRPLDYGQVCPLLYLWGTKLAVDVFGFSTWSLRLLPLLCAVGSVWLFRHVAARTLSGVPLALAVAIFAVSYHPIRHAADVKPYASDLFVALAMLAIAVEWWRSPERSGWLWGLAAFGPIAIAASYPAAFVAGGIGLALVPAVARSRSWEAWAALASYLLGIAATFLGLYFVMTRAQAADVLGPMSVDWGGSFVPIDVPWMVPIWLVVTHAGDMLAYPCGGERGGSAVSLLLVLVGLVAFWSRGRQSLVGLLLMPVVLALIASGLRRYPYGGDARFMQYLAPAACLLAGLGAARLLALVRNRRWRFIVLRALLAMLFVIGVVPLAADLARPYRSVHSREARAFAQRFWPEVEQGAEVACLRWDFGVGDWNSIDLRIPVYLCNQAIESRSRREGGPRFDRVTADRPLRVVISLVDEDEPAIHHWLAEMEGRYAFVGRRSQTVNMAGPGATPRMERYLVVEFVPREPGPSQSGASRATSSGVTR